MAQAAQTDIQVGGSAVKLQERGVNNTRGEGGNEKGTAGRSMLGVHIDPSVHAAKLQRAWRAYSRRHTLMNHVRRIQATWRGYSTRFHLAEHFHSASRQRQTVKQSQERTKHRKHVAAIARARELRIVEQLLSTCSPCAKVSRGHGEIQKGTHVEVSSCSDASNCGTSSECSSKQDNINRVGTVVAVHSPAEVAVWKFFLQQKLTHYYGAFLKHMPEKVASVDAVKQITQANLTALCKKQDWSADAAKISDLLQRLRKARSCAVDKSAKLSYSIEFDSGKIEYHLAPPRIQKMDERRHILEKYVESQTKRQQMVGLEPVKRWLDEVNIDTLARYAHGEPLQPINVVLMGGPGTGKRTAARMIASSLFALGLVEHHKLDECDYIYTREKKGIKKGHVNYTGVDDFDDKHTLEAPDLWRWLLAEGIGDHKTVLLWGASSAEASGYVQRACPAFASVQFLLPALKARQVAEIALQRFEDLELCLETESLSPSGAESESSSARSRQIALLEEAISAQYPPKDIEAKSGYLAAIFVNAVVSRKSQRLGLQGSDAISHQWLSAMGRIVHADLGLSTGQDKQQRSQCTDEIARETERAEVEAELDRMEGMEEAKKLLRSLGKKCRTVETSGTSKRVLHVCNNLILMGNPGVGKSTFARLMFRYFKAHGVVRRDSFVDANALDLIGRYVGSTGPKVKNIVASAHGGMLFIDEAYALTPKNSGGSFNSEAIRMLLTEIENNRESLLVVLAGYEKQMEEFLMSDPGLRSRFPHTLKLPNYSPSQLAAIAASTAENKFDLQLEPGLQAQLAKEWAAKHSCMLSKYNARFAVQQVEIATEKYIERLGDSNVIKCKTANVSTAADFGTDHADTAVAVAPVVSEAAAPCKPLLLGRDFGLEDVADEAQKRKAKIAEVEAEIDRLIGADTLKQHMQQLKALVAYVNQRGGDPIVLRQCLNLVLVGNPGTGKTTAARLIGKFLAAHGVLQSDNCVEMNALELMGEYCGQTAPKVKSAFERASGGVLFLDEAYALHDEQGCSTKFAGEAVRMLLTEIEENRVDTMVILAGYEDKMHRFLAVDPGLRSRFPTTVRMKDLSGTELALVAEGYALDRFKLKFAPGLRGHLTLAFDNKRFGNTQRGNGRLAVNAVEGALRALAERVIADESCDIHELQRVDFGIGPQGAAGAA